MSLDSPFFDALRQRTKALGGIHNAHLHIDRAGTYSPSNQSNDYRLALHEKHALIKDIHADSGFKTNHLRDRVNGYLQTMIQVGTRRADSVVDITTDNIGLNSFHTLLELKNSVRDHIDFRIGAYTPMGFRDDEPGRWQLLADAAKEADFIGSLPERDDKNRYPDHIGFKEHCRRIIELSLETNKPLQMHLDQHADPREHETEILLDVLDDLGVKRSVTESPAIWVIHFISPSFYPPQQQLELLERMKFHGIGVICCPSAALSMRQLSSLQAPMGNSIAPILPLLANGIDVLLGSDNIADICSPAGTPDLIDEVYTLCNAIRFYDIDILAKLAAGQPITQQEQQLVIEHLQHDQRAIESSMDYQAPH